MREHNTPHLHSYMTRHSNIYHWFMAVSKMISSIALTFNIFGVLAGHCCAWTPKRVFHFRFFLSTFSLCVCMCVFMHFPRFIVSMTGCNIADCTYRCIHIVYSAPFQISDTFATMRDLFFFSPIIFLPICVHVSVYLIRSSFPIQWDFGFRYILYFVCCICNTRFVRLCYHWK